MKFNRKCSIFPLFILGFLILISVPGCKKYPDGPGFSLASRTERLANTWKVDNYKVNGTDYTTLVSDYNETFTTKGAYSYSWGVLKGAGTWAFQNKDNEVKITGVAGQSDRVIFIQKLEEKALWYYFMDGTDKHEMHLIQK